MPQTVLQLVQDACHEAGITAPSALYGATDPATLRILKNFYATGRELRQSRCWAQLKRTYSVILQSNRTDYHLPSDFFASLPMTEWDQQNRWEMRGPLGDAEWNYRTYGYVTWENRKAFRVFGPDINPNSTRGQFHVNPMPGAGEAGYPITFEYISKSWLLPPSWTASEGIGSTNLYRNANGNIYRSSVTGITGSNPPSMVYGEGQDGGVFWTALTTPAWGAGTAYAPGDYVTNSSNLYVCTTGGVSAGSGGPTTTSDAITDNTVTWQYCAESSWTALTEFARGSFIKISSQYYKATTPTRNGNGTAITGKVQPNWTTTTQTDGTVTWTDFLGSDKGAYERIQSDSDLVLFDDDLIIMGLKWRLLRSAGLVYEDVRADYELNKGRAAARFNPMRTLDLGRSGYSHSLNVPEGNFNV